MRFSFARMFAHSVFKNASALAVMQAANFLVPLLVLPYLTRVLGLEAFGVVAITLAAIQLAYVVTDYGFSLSATYRIARERDDREKVAQLLGSIFLSKTLLLLVAGIALLVLPLISGYQDYQMLFVVALIAVVGQAFQPVWFFQGIERMKSVTIYMVLTKVIYAAFVFLFVSEESDAVLVILGWGIAQVVGAIVAIRQVYVEGYRIRVPSVGGAFRELKDGAQFFWSRVAVASYTSASTVIVGVSGGSVQAAQFSVCEQIYKAGQGLTNPINQALYPYMAKQKSLSVFLRITLLVGFGLALICSGAAFFAEDLLTIFFGQEYIKAAPVLILFLVASVINYIGASFGYPACAALDIVGVANKSVIVGFLIHVVMLTALWFSDLISAYTVVLAIIATEFFVMSYRLSSVLSAINHRVA